MIDSNDFECRCSYSLVNFKDFPDDDLRGAIYIENKYHAKFNRYMRFWGWWTWNLLYNNYIFDNIELVYLPCMSKSSKWRKHVQYQYPYLPKEITRKLSDLKTKVLLDYLENPDDVRFLKPGFLFFREKKYNGISVYEYYPLCEIENKFSTYKTQISEILKAHQRNAEENNQYESRGIGHGGVYCQQPKRNEDFADNSYEALDSQTKAQVHLFRKQVMELQKRGVPMDLLESILYQNVKLSTLVITKKHQILLPEYHNMEIKLEPLVKAVYLLFLSHPEGILFKHLPDYREELTQIYLQLKPNGINDKTRKSIEDLTNPLNNSINEKCARIHAAFIDKFDKYLARNYYITGERAEPKKIILPRDLVVWE